MACLLLTQCIVALTFLPSGADPPRVAGSYVHRISEISPFSEGIPCFPSTVPVVSVQPGSMDCQLGPGLMGKGSHGLTHGDTPVSGDRYPVDTKGAWIGGALVKADVARHMCSQPVQGIGSNSQIVRSNLTRGGSCKIELCVR